MTIEGHKMMVEGSIEKIAKTLRNMAELTANNTQNWGNYEAILRDAIEQIVKQAQRTK
jgi:hypothetical protein